MAVVLGRDASKVVNVLNHRP